MKARGQVKAWVITYAAPVLLLLYFGQPAWVPLILLTLPLAVRLVRAVFTASSYALNRTLTGTAQLAVLYLAAFAVGLVL